jgi:hypothetical protein
MKPPKEFVTFESVCPTPDIKSPTLLADVAKVALEMRKARPWTLVELPGEPLYVAAKRSLWMRVVVWWANRHRTRERKLRQALLAARFAELDRRRAMGLPLNDGSST